ncbi:MAG: TonB family protein [Pseudomonadota bacterium]|nr:TonB family protein [Pseudomonadota bacterium]
MSSYLRCLVIAVAAHALLWAGLHFLMLSSSPVPQPPLRVKVIPHPALTDTPLTSVPHTDKQQTSADKVAPPQAKSVPPPIVSASPHNPTATKGKTTAKTLIANPAANKDTYAEFLQRSAQAMADVAWQEEDGADEIIDINTNSYRYGGYLTAMRNAISLVWHYPPRAAQEGQQGLVRLDFTVNSQGYASSIQVIKSSGYHLLDRAIIAAIHAASPFQPLPASIGKDNIRIRGSFWYVLN